MKKLLLTLIFFIFCVLPSQAAITRVQEISNTGQSTTPSATFSGASTSGNLLVAVIECNPSGYPITTPTGWTAAVNNNNGNGNPIYIFYKANASATTTVSTTISASTRWIMFIAEYSGCQTSSPLDQTATGTGPPGYENSGTLNTLYNKEVIVAGLDNAYGNVYSSPTGGFTLVDQQTNGASSSAAYLDNIVSMTGSYSTSANDGGNGNGVSASFIDATANMVQGNALWAGEQF